MQIYDFLLEQSCISRCLTLIASQISNFIADTNHFWVQWKITGKAPSFWNSFPMFFPLSPSLPSTVKLSAERLLLRIGVSY